MTAKLGSRLDVLRIVSDDSPRGGVVDMPVARFATVDASRTAGRNKGTISIDRAMFEQIIENFSKRAGPVPVYFGHGKRQPDTPAIGYVRKAWLEGDTLWNQLELGPKAWDLIVIQRGFAAASVELDKDAERALGKIDGWSESGLAITNDPALDVQYIAAANDGTSSEVVVTPGVPLQKEKVMPDITLEGLQADKLRLEAELTQKATTVQELQAKLEDKDKAHGGTASALSEAQLKLAQANASLTEKNGTILALEKKVESLTADLSSAATKAARLEAEAQDGNVRKIVKVALANGVDAKYFDGCEANPSSWLKANFASLEALQKFVDALPRRKGAVLSQKPDEEGEVAVPSDIAAQLRRRGLDPKYAALENSEQLAEMKANSK